MFGHVVEHEKGYRAEQAMIKALGLCYSKVGYPLLTTFLKLPSSCKIRLVYSMGHPTAALLEQMRQIHWTFDNQLDKEEVREHFNRTYGVDTTITPATDVEEINNIAPVKSNLMRSLQGSAKRIGELECIDELLIEKLLSPQPAHKRLYRTTAEALGTYSSCNCGKCFPLHTKET
jgi:hypothetical protein